MLSLIDSFCIVSFNKGINYSEGHLLETLSQPNEKICV